MAVDKGVKKDGFSNGGIELKKEEAVCIGCSELQAKLKRTNNKCANLELEIEKKKCVIEWLECKLSSIESQKLKMEDEIRVLKQRNEEREKGFRDDKKEHDFFSELTVKNKVLECKKKEAETEVEIWKVKCKELEIKVMELEKKLSSGMFQSDSHLLEEHSDKDLLGSPPTSPLLKQCLDVEGFNGCQRELNPTVRKWVDFSGEENPDKNIPPSTPPFDPIDISDTDDDLNTSHQHFADLHCTVRNKVRSSCTGLWVTLDEKESTLKEAVVKKEEDVTRGQLYLRMPPKRRNVKRRVSSAVSSDSEREDNIPISRLTSINPRKQSSGSASAEFLQE